MEPIGERVDDRHRCLARQLQAGVVGKGANHDQVDPARQIARDVFGRFALADPDIVRRQVIRMTTELRHAGFEADPGAQLGGHAIYLAPNDIGIGERESAKDVARNLSRWVDLIMIRTFSHDTLLELAREASVPVINALTDRLHPCQLLADLQVLQEHFGRDLRKLRIAFVGDGFNLAQSWIEAASLIGFELRLGIPPGYGPDKSYLARLRHEECGVLTHDPIEAVKDADV